MTTVNAIPARNPLSTSADMNAVLAVGNNVALVCSRRALSKRRPSTTSKPKSAANCSAPTTMMGVSSGLTPLAIGPSVVTNATRAVAKIATTWTTATIDGPSTSARPVATPSPMRPCPDSSRPVLSGPVLSGPDVSSPGWAAGARGLCSGVPFDLRATAIRASASGATMALAQTLAAVAVSRPRYAAIAKSDANPTPIAQRCGGRRSFSNNTVIDRAVTKQPAVVTARAASSMGHERLRCDDIPANAANQSHNIQLTVHATATLPSKASEARFQRRDVCVRERSQVQRATLSMVNGKSSSQIACQREDVVRPLQW